MRSRTTARPLVVVLVLLACCSGAVVASNPSPQPEVRDATTAATNAPSLPEDSAQLTDRGVGTNGTLEVHYIDVGQGSSTLLVGPTNETMLVDSGDWRADGSGVIDYLDRRNVSRIDYLVTTHADADHVGGHAAVIEHLETESEGVGAVYDPGIAAATRTYRDYLDAVEEHDVTLYRTRAGDRIPFEGVRVEVLAPPEDDLAGGDRNENSLVLRTSYGNSSFLFPGDAAELEEAYLLERYGPDLDSTVLQVGHHGSRSSTSAAFLDASSPSIATVSSAYDSRYGHPHEETLRRLAERDVTTLWTGIHGSIAATSNGTHLRLFVQSAATTDPAALRSAPPFSGDDSAPLVRVGVVSLDEPGEGSPAIADGGAQSTPEEVRETTVSGDAESASLVVEGIHADARGEDHENLNDEYVVFANTDGSVLDLTGWTVEDGAGRRFAFPDGFTLPPGETVTLRTGSGDDTSSDLYWGSESAVWNNGGDTIIVTDADGEVVLEDSY